MRIPISAGLGLALLTAGAATASAEEAQAPKPALSWNLKGVTVQVPVQVTGRLDDTSSYPIDAPTNGAAPASEPAGLALSPLVRVGLGVDTGALMPNLNLHLGLEGDLVTGMSELRKGLPGVVGPTAEQPLTMEARQAYLRAVIARRFLVQGGLMTSHWGLGLVANDGAHGWTPGSAEFIDPREGDRVIRGMIATVPLTKWALVAAAGFDKVYADPTLLTASEMPPGSGLGSDTAYQAFAAFTFGYEKPTTAGIYFVQRWQTAADGRYLHPSVVDVTGATELELGQKAKLRLAGEGAYIGGTTNFGASSTFPTQKLQQVGAVGRAGLDLGSFGGVLDVLYASGDQNLSDGSQNGFMANPNFTMGLLLYRDVIASQTGRAPITAGNPGLVGELPSGLERYPTRGSITNTVAFFPRAWVRPAEGLEIYGGPLFALAPASMADPLNTSLAGCSPRNALDGSPGGYLGTELDVGIRYRVALHGTWLTAGLEGGALIPGSALDDAAGHAMGTVGGGRLIIDYRL